jgi:hypothetical protein
MLLRYISKSLKQDKTCFPSLMVNGKQSFSHFLICICVLDV